MRRRRVLGVAIPTAVLQLLYAYPAQAYIDVGTTGSMFAVLAPFAAVALAFIGLLIRPVRVFITSWAARLRGNHGATTFAERQSTGAGDLPEGENSREATGEDHED